LKIKQVKGQEKSSPGYRYSKEELLARTRDLSALLTVAETTTRSLNIEKILKDTLDKSLGILGFDAGFIRVLDAEKKGMVLRVARGFRSPQGLTEVTPIDSERRNPSRIVFETKDSYVSLDIRKDPVYKNRTMEREGVVSAAAAPLLSKDRVLGIIVVGSRRYHKFTKGEVRLLMAFGSQLGMALENAQLYNEASEAKAYIENLMENAGDAIISTDM